jgi:ABC-type multidrug transport system fused ATPase/permease subunit
VPQEKQDNIVLRLESDQWPSEGVVAFNDVQLRYRDHLPLALRGVTFETKPEEKIGVVGRTGAGKTSLTAALFRTADVCGGSVTIDGVDLSDVGLAELRRSMAAIPQQPFLFSGSVRDISYKRSVNVEKCSETRALEH